MQSWKKPFTYCSSGHTWYSTWLKEKNWHVKQNPFLTVSLPQEEKTWKLIGKVIHRKSGQFCTFMGDSKTFLSLFFFMWVVSLISDCNYFMPMHNGLNVLYAFWDAKWMKNHRWKFMPAVKWHLEHIVIPTSLYIMKIKYYLKHSEIFYSLFPLSCLDRYHHLVVCYYFLAGRKEGLKAPSKATSAINANASL